MCGRVVPNGPAIWENFVVEVQLEPEQYNQIHREQGWSTRDLGLVWQNVGKLNGSNREKPGMERWDGS